MRENITRIQMTDQGCMLRAYDRALVDTLNAAPSAPTLQRPALDAQVATLRPELGVLNAVDPEGESLTYRFEIDRALSFDTPSLQTADVAEGAGETAWTPPAALADNTFYYWRVAASDGTTRGPWGEASRLRGCRPRCAHRAVRRCEASIRRCAGG